MMSFDPHKMNSTTKRTGTMQIGKPAAKTNASTFSFQQFPDSL
jgi:hypothetical protein